MPLQCQCRQIFHSTDVVGRQWCNGVRLRKLSIAMSDHLLVDFKYFIGRIVQNSLLAAGILGSSGELLFCGQAQVAARLLRANKHGLVGCTESSCA